MLDIDYQKFVDLIMDLIDKSTKGYITIDNNNTDIPLEIVLENDFLNIVNDLIRPYEILLCIVGNDIEYKINMVTLLVNKV